jgi:hypothetical protein
MAHIIAVYAHCIRNARPQIDRLVYQGRECPRFFQRETFGEMLKGILERTTCADFEVGQMDIGTERRIALTGKPDRCWSVRADIRLSIYTLGPT